MRRQWLEGGPDVNQGPTGGTDVKFFQVKIDEFLHKLKDLTTRRWNPGRFWTFIERIQDDKNCTLIRKNLIC